jgi:SAM-dependent methyltransferase
MAYMSEAAKVKDMPQVMKYITGKVLDIGCADAKITPEAFGVDGRAFPGVDYVCENIEILSHYECWPDVLPRGFDVIFSSHLLEHLADPWGFIHGWSKRLVSGGHFVLYLPQKGAYDSHQNEEHLWNWQYEDFMFWFRRTFCGEGKDFKGEHLPKMFELVDHALDIGEDRYSFYLIAKKL